MSNSTHPSTVSLLSTATVTSTTPLTSSKKDDSSTYVVKQTTTQNTESSSAPSSSAVPSAASQPKDFEAAFGKLSSSYGYGGQMPTLPRKKDNKKSKSKKYNSLFSSSGKPTGICPQAYSSTMGHF